MCEKLTICYNAWMIFNENDDYDDQIFQIADRGFNCVRIEAGAGLLWDKAGNVRDDVLISAPFGEYTKYTTYKVIVNKKRLNLMERLLRICRAAQKHKVKVVLSSWFFLHTNWYCEEADKRWIYDMSTEEKMSFFADQLSRILDVLKQENLIDVVAFAEIFNEFEGLPFAQNSNKDKELSDMLRCLHEKEIAKLKKHHPDVLFAYDSVSAYVREEMIPRNIDVLNFHCYYLWPVYEAFEKDLIQFSLEEMEIPDSTRYFLKEQIVTVKEVVEAMDNFRSGLDWPRRISLYLSIDSQKEAALTAMLDKELEDNFDQYTARFRKGIDKVIATHATAVPNSKLVMGEGATYCASPTLLFERDSEHFWKVLKEQMVYARDKGLWGTVITTTHAPERSAAWDGCREQYRQLNGLFLQD